MSRARALLWALLLLAVAFPALSTPVLDLIGRAARWLAGEPTLPLTVVALALTGWALRPRHATKVLGGPQ